MLAFTSVYFFESGLFNGLQPVQTKISPPPNLATRLRAERFKPQFLPLSLPRYPPAQEGPEVQFRD
jgi:hypothetical protein